jgi:protein-L-isoaspartate(D-aspartate) O-methyltransferase
MLIDNYRHKGLRRQMLESLKQQGINDEKVLEAMDKVPRHFFLDSSLDNIAYENRRVVIGCEQTISAPFTVAYQTTLLEVKQREKILEIGTGSGYQTAILYYLGARIYTIERQKSLYEKANKVFEQMNIYPKSFFDDGYKGLEKYAPFDKILVTCAAPYVPQTLINQLKPNGFIIIPVGEETQKMQKITLTSDNKLITQTYGDFHFVKMLENKVN